MTHTTSAHAVSSHAAPAEDSSTTAKKPRAPHPDPGVLAHAVLAPIHDACLYSGISRSRLYLLMKSGDIRFAKLGKRTLICMDSLRAFIASLTSPGVPA